MSSRGIKNGTSVRYNNNNSQIDNSLDKSMTTITKPSDQSQRFTGTYAEFIKEKERAAKAAYLQMRHNLIEPAVLDRKRDIESRTVTLKDGRRVVLPRRSKDAVINMIAESSKYDRE